MYKAVYMSKDRKNTAILPKERVKALSSISVSGTSVAPPVPRQYP